ncbi:Tic20 family protein [Cyanobacterium sp. uoEpiScrs1]|uniref:Tic20 family protein n=1 Tax=Cyanobacterium sp. uoEpiScrs1 TaxID=2976343 RepID=UPI00226A7674|nr:Tic20 family protein [Cyanobacterium sp. uoEpiScrs1]
MNWRGSIEIKERIFGTLVYCFAIFDTIFFSNFLVNQFPIFSLFLLPGLPIAVVYQFSVQLFGMFGSFLVFIILFLGIVRNDRISHFVRYNTMQSILIGILLSLIRLIMQWVLVPAFGNGGLLIETLYNVVFLGSITVSYYSMVQSVLGRYAEIPTISEAAYSQVRY